MTIFLSPEKQSLIEEKTMTDDSYIIVFVTCADKAEAEKISQTLVSERLIACAKIISPVTSFFRWKGKVERTEECLIVMKSKQSLFGELEVRLRGLHSYEVPEVLAVPIVEGSAAYLGWMGENLK
jgi:periplasmic divalent cation tolerance protein